VLDIKHSEAWNAEVLHSLVAEDPRRGGGPRGGGVHSKRGRLTQAGVKSRPNEPWRRELAPPINKRTERNNEGLVLAQPQGHPMR
jgi:hypothetical protein